MKHMLAALLLGTLAVLAPAAARAQQDDSQVQSREGIALGNQIAELRHDVQLLRDQVAHASPPPPPETGSALGGFRTQPAAGGGATDLATQLLQRVTQLEEEVRLLRGRADEADNARLRQGEDLNKQIADLNFKVDGIAGGGGGGGNAGIKPAAGGGDTAAIVPPPPPVPPAAPVRRSAETALQEGNAALTRRDYPAAEQAAREVLAGPRSPRTADANFLLAQALAGKKDWAKAAVAFDDTYNRAKTGPHAPDSLLGLSVALLNLDEKKAACEELDRLHAEFPAPRADLRDLITAVHQRAKCH